PGTVGHGIADAAGLAGCPVTLSDSRPDALPQALERIGELLAGGVKRGKLTEGDRSAVAERVRGEPALAAAVRDADVVIEAVVEDLAVKRQVFAHVERAAPAGALLATNTSSLSVASIGSALRDPGRPVGMHFFNPVPAMTLVEVVTP